MGAIISCVFSMQVAIIWRERNHLRFQAGQFYADKLYKEFAVHVYIVGKRKTQWTEQYSLGTCI